MTKELYLGLVIDRSAGCPVMMASSEGGVEIEKVAAETPEKIKKAYLHPGAGMQAFQARQLAFGIGLEGAAVGQATRLMLGALRRVRRRPTRRCSRSTRSSSPRPATSWRSTPR
jgi:succinyl-CoA synthetase beta subunit